MALNTADNLNHVSGFYCIDSCDILLQHEIDKFAAQFVSQVGLCVFLKNIYKIKKVTRFCPSIN